MLNTGENIGRLREQALSQQEVADVMTARGEPMCRAMVANYERRAMHKIKRLLMQDADFIAAMRIRNA